MKKYIRHYVELVSIGLVFGEPKDVEVESRNPLDITCDDSVDCFRFFDQPIVVDGNDTYYGDACNFTNWVYFGERITLDEFKALKGDDFSTEMKIESLKERGIEYVCHTRNNRFLEMRIGDKTFDEVKEESKPKKPVSNLKLVTAAQKRQVRK